LLATYAGNHLITISMEALDQKGQAVDSRTVDIPVTILAQPESLSTTIGVLGGLVTIFTALIGLWQQFGGTTASDARRAYATVVASSRHSVPI
jgi:hypothetical protein